MIDTEKAQLDTAIQAVRDNGHIRRPDGRKSPMMLLGEEVLRLRDQAAKHKATLSRMLVTVDHAIASAIKAESRLERIESSRWVRLGRWLRVIA
jgi:hypothetical protein